MGTKLLSMGMQFPLSITTKVSPLDKIIDFIQEKKRANKRVKIDQTTI